MEEREKEREMANIKRPGLRGFEWSFTKIACSWEGNWLSRERGGGEREREREEVAKLEKNRCTPGKKFENSVIAAAMFEKLVHDGLLNLSHVQSSLTLVARSETENYAKLSNAFSI